MNIETIRKLVKNLEVSLRNNTIQQWAPDNVDVHDVTIRYKGDLSNEGFRTYYPERDYMAVEQDTSQKSTEFDGYYGALMELKNEIFKGEKPYRYHSQWGICEWEWICYNDIRESGEFNMLDPKAREGSDIEKSNWWVIVHNYEELSKFFD